MRTVRARKALLLLTVLLLPTLAACGTAGGEEPSLDAQVQQNDAPSFEWEIDPNKETLIYANLSPAGIPSSVDRDAIDKFNRSHEDIQIVVKDYWNADAADAAEAAQGRDRLVTELAAGQVPDIIDLGVYPLPYRQLAEKGYLEDLWPYIENDPDLGRENVVEAPLKAAEVNGGLYAAFGAVSINTLLGAVEQLGDRTSWTLAELQDTLTSMPEDSSIVEFYASRETISSSVLPMLLDSCVDWASGTCSFDTPAFRGVLEFIGTFPTQEEVENTVDMSSAESAYALYQDVEERILTGHQMLERNVNGLYDVMRMDLRHGGRCSFVGYPVGDGSIGSSFQPYGQRLAMSSTCKNKDAAWELIRTILLPSYNPNEYLTHFPINRTDYDLAKQDVTQKKQPLNVSTFAPQIVEVSMEEERFQQFEAYFNSINKIDLEDDPLYDLVMETCAPYFAGDKSLDETVDLVQRRATLYVNEKR